jgi:DNA mismatch repair protein MSH6
MPLLADFRVLLVRFQPKEIVFGQEIPEVIMGHIRDLPGVLLTKVPHDVWSGLKLMQKLQQNQFFGANHAKWPKCLQNAIERGKKKGVDGIEVKHAFDAMGGAVKYLERCLIDVQLVSQGKLYWYDVESGSKNNLLSSANLQTIHSAEEGSLANEPDIYLQLDSEAIQHLELTSTNDDGSEVGTVLGYLNHCVTAFGKRELQQWVLFPLFNRKAILARQAAIRNLMALQEQVDKARSQMRKLPDLERLLSRNHTNGSEYMAKTHPAGRAIMYENSTYNSSKIKNFVQLLNGLRTVMQIARLFEDAKLLTAPLLQSITSTQYGFPDLKNTLTPFDTAFDPDEALANGFIVPKTGFDELYDDCVRQHKDVLRHLHEYLIEIRETLDCQKVTFVDAKKKNAFQLEIPEFRVGRTEKGKKGNHQLPSHIKWEFKGARKGWERYTTPKLAHLIQELQMTKDAKEKAVLEITRRMFHRFNLHVNIWLAAVKAFTTLDCLMSLMLVSKLNEPMCCPQILPEGSKASIKLVRCRHPCIAETFSGDDFVPNDVIIGGEDAPTSLLLTGPNMGGKSTLLRQVATCVILAQIGCYVPAESATLSLVDRIFTRLGANDDIMAQKSTFFIELSETAKVLKYASANSLVILDELGRGTSTFDGAAIATSVLSYLTTNIKCATLFSTHYHNLVEQFSREKVVGLGHMDFIIDKHEDDDIEKVIFLYKLVPGACPKSFGMNVARLADLPKKLIQLAATKSTEFEANLRKDHNKEMQLIEKSLLLADINDDEQLCHIWQHFCPQ